MSQKYIPCFKLSPMWCKLTWESLDWWILIAKQGIFCAHIYIYIYIYTHRIWQWGVLGVIITVIGNEHGDSSSNWGLDCSHFTYYWHLWEIYESNYPPFSYGLIVEKGPHFQPILAYNPILLVLNTLIIVC